MIHCAFFPLLLGQLSLEFVRGKYVVLYVRGQTCSKAPDAASEVLLSGLVSMCCVAACLSVDAERVYKMFTRYSKGMCSCEHWCKCVLHADVNDE